MDHGQTKKRKVNTRDGNNAIANATHQCNNGPYLGRTAHSGKGLCLIYFLGRLVGETFRQRRGDAKITQDQVVCFTFCMVFQQDVFRFQITMDNAFVMDVRHRTGNVEKDFFTYYAA